MPNKDQLLKGETITQLHQKVREMRHTTNGKLTIILMAIEMQQKKHFSPEKCKEITQAQVAEIQKAQESFKKALELELGIKTEFPAEKNQPENKEKKENEHTSSTSLATASHH